MEYDKINVFEYKILFKNIASDEIRLPKSSMNNYNLYEFKCSKVINIINNYITKILKINDIDDKLLKKNIKNDKNIKNNKNINSKKEYDNVYIHDKIEKDNNVIIDNNTIDNNKVENIVIDNNIYFNIPILWIPCIKLKKYIKMQKISKPTIRNHYKTCINCEINNNNRFDIDFDNKILFNNCLDKEELNSIIRSYSYGERYYNKQNIISSYEYEKNKINIICIKEDYILNKYDDCLFIIF